MNLLEEIKHNVLVEAISAIHINEVEIKNPDDKNILIYIKTNDLSTVDKLKLEDICEKYSSNDILVSYQIPTGKYSKVNKEVLENKDTVCIFIEN